MKNKIKECVFFINMILLLSVCLTSCGEREEEEIPWKGIAPGMEDLTAVTDRTVYYDVAVETEEFPDPGLWGKNTEDEHYFSALVDGKTVYYPVNVQFYKGEPVQLWAEQTLKSLQLSLYRSDGTKELLLDSVSSEYINKVPAYQWYMAQEGDFYCYATDYTNVNGEYTNEGVLVKMNSSGEVLYRQTMGKDTGIIDMCQTEEGRVYIVWEDMAGDTQAVAEVEPDTGVMIDGSRIDLPYKPHYVTWLGTAGNALAVIGSNPEKGQQVTKVDPADKSLSPILYFAGTSYGWGNGSLLCDMRVMEDGSLELLWSDQHGNDCHLDKVRMEKVEKTPIVLRGIRTASWLADRTAEFNRENDEYHVVIEDCGEGNDEEDFARLTSVQIGAGKGPDILCGGLLEGYILGMLEKGALEELNPYMDASGIREEDYFPMAFSTWRQGEKIYGVNFILSGNAYLIDEKVLGSRETPDMETMLEALLQWEGDGICLAGYDSAALLNMFLKGSESLYGMVDWAEEGTGLSGSCDFNTKLFADMLEAARRYGDDGRRNEPVSIMRWMRLDNLIHFRGQAQREAEGWVAAGIQFDEGCGGASSSWSTLAVNANSAHKEGAWEFIRYLLSEEAQSTVSEWFQSPVHRGVFEKHMQEDVIDEMVVEHYVNGVLYYPAYYGEDVSEEKQAEYLRALEEIRPLPLRTEPIIEIILEEAGDYFNGSKSAGEVSQVVGNRVRLFLEEQK